MVANDPVTNVINVERYLVQEMAQKLAGSTIKQITCGFMDAHWQLESIMAIAVFPESDLTAARHVREASVLSHPEWKSISQSQAMNRLSVPGVVYRPPGYG